MPRMSWDAVGARNYESGVDRGVLYVAGLAGVPWNGLKSVEESPTGGEVSSYYYDGVNYLNAPGLEEFEATITALYSPPEFDVCDGVVAFSQGFMGAQQFRRSFGLSYRTKIGNDTDGADSGYKLHLVYNAMAKPSSKAYNSTSDSPETVDLSWAITTTPVAVPYGRPTAHFIVDSTRADPMALAALEDMLYGSDSGPSSLPLPTTIVGMFDPYALVIVRDNGDGTFTITAPPDILVKTGNSFTLAWPSAVFIDADTYRISSL